MKLFRSFFHPSLNHCVRRYARPITSIPQAQTCGMGIGIMVAIAPFALERAAAVDRTWIGGNVDWIDNGSTSNWTGSDEPDMDDTAIFNIANTVNLGSNNTILGLTMSSGISLNTNGFDLTVNGLLQLVNGGTDLTIGGATSSVSAYNITINSAADMLLDGGTLTLDNNPGSGLFEINANGILRGQGTVSLRDALAAPTSLLTNRGTITAVALGAVGNPPSGTLAINADSPNARLDLDFGGSPRLNVFRNQTLDINVTLAEAYSNDLNLFHSSTIDVSTAWSIDAGTVDIENGFVNNGGINDIPASTSFIKGAAFSQTGGTITVIDADGALQFDALFTMSGGSLVNNGEVIFNADATIGSAANFTMPTTTSSLTVNAGVEVNVNQLNFDPDGGDLATNVITIGSLGILDLDLGLGADTVVSNTINLNGGELDVTTDSNTWKISGAINVGAATGTSQLNGDALSLTSVPVTVGAGSILDINATSSWLANAAVGTGSTLRLDGADSVLGGGSFTGAGTMVIGSTCTVTASTTVATGTFDWDGAGGGSLHTINDGDVFTITSGIFDSDGDMDDRIDLGGNGAGLTVSGPVSWEMKGTLTSNTIATGVATIAGTSRMELTTATGILNVNGSTAISAPVTFGSLSTTNIAAAAALTLTVTDTIYDGSTITGLGTYNPPSRDNTVSSNSTISCRNFDFDRGGNWTVNAGATLTVNVSDYDSNSSTDEFDTAITLNSGSASVTSGDPSFVMAGVLNFDNTTGIIPTWSGDPLDIGNDTGVRDSDLNVAGAGISEINTAITFQSDADVNVAAGCTLLLTSTATFNSVNLAANADFTGTGKFTTGGSVNFNESTTLKFLGGTVDLDGIGSDNTANTINVDAPVVINAAAIDSFGNGGNLSGSANTIDIDGDAGTGILTVNLDDPASEWILNASSVLSLTNDSIPATLLSGSAVNLNGTVNVTGDVITEARVDIGSTGIVNILAAQPFRLSGGNLLTTNTINGGIINGPGLLGAVTDSALTGFGTISADIDFDSDSDLLADNGILTVNSTILDARNIGTADVDGTLNVVNAWNSSVITTLLMQGGLFQGGTVTLDNPNGMTGHGDVSAAINNNTQIHANIAGKTLKLTNSLNDWDGTDVPEDGILRASNGGTLECNDTATFPFEGTINAFTNGTVFSNGFAFSLAPTSTLSLASGGTYKSTNTIDIRGAVTVGGGADSTIDIEINRFLDFEATSTTTLTGNLRLVTNNGIIRAGATFGGGGTLRIPTGSSVILADSANVNVQLNSSGRLRVAGPNTGRVDAKDFQQSASGELEIDLNGTVLASYDRLLVGGTAQIGGDLLLDIGGGYVPALGDTFNVLAATGGVLGTFNPLVQPVGMPAGLEFEVTYTANLVQLKVVAISPFDTWINTFVSLVNPADKTKAANPDGDELSNLGEFGLDGNPASGISSGKIVGKIAPVGGVNAMTLTFPVRNGAILDVGDPAAGELVLKQVTDELTYRVQATDDFVSFPLTVTEVLPGLDATAIQLGLPAPSAGWTYRTFRSPGGVAGDPVEFMRVVVSP